MIIESLPSDLQEKAKACKTIEELQELAELEGFELSAEDLDAIAGGHCAAFGCRKFDSSQEQPYPDEFI